MKKFLAALLLSFAVVRAAESTTPAVAAKSAEADWEEVQAFIKSQRANLTAALHGRAFTDVPRQEMTQLQDPQLRAIREKLEAFYAAHLDSPLRWKAVDEIRNMRSPSFITSFGPNFQEKGLADAVVDETAKAAWSAKVDALVDLMATAPDTPRVNRESADFHILIRTMRAADATAKKTGATADLAELRRLFDRFAAKYDGTPNLDGRASYYIGVLNTIAPGSADAEWRRLVDSPSAEIHESAAAKVRRMDIAAQPLDLAFAAVDGRAVDLTNLRRQGSGETSRGKVVLVDFWATWCGPCKAELPNVKKVYAAYHDKGFDVVGIALEDAKLTPKDTLEQTADKLAKAKKVLTDFTTAEQMPWPQYFDGKYWKNDISTRYAINSIPAMFLLDQSGKVVSTNARGEKLEQEVKRLLGL